jgi:hypothetical protein
MKVCLKLVVIDNGVRVVSFHTRKSHFQAYTVPTSQRSKYNFTTPDGKAHSQIDYFFTDKDGIQI